MGLDGRRAERALRWDLVGVAGALMAAVGFGAFIDTGAMAGWLAAHQASKVDEAIVLSFVLACAGGVLAIRRWLGVSYRLIRFEASQEPAYLADAAQVQRALRRDLIGFATALVVAVLLLPVIDTGGIASWIARRSQTRVDEALVITFVVMVGLTVFGIRRWVEVTRQLMTASTLHRAASELNREMTILSELGELLQSCRLTVEAHRLIANRAGLLFAGSSGAICVTNDASGTVDVVATWGRPAFVDTVFALDACWALRRGRPHAASGEAAIVCAHVGLPRPARSLCVPMVAHGDTLGVLHISGPSGPTPDGSGGWSDADQRTARTVADQAALALANLTLREALARQAIRDALTGLYNRPYFSETLAREVRRAVNLGAPLALLLVDVDHFKALNDALGADAGDATLRVLADLLRSAFGEGDVVCRWGGGAFAILMPETHRDEARARAEAVRGAMERMVVMVRGPVPARATISVGVSSFPEDGSTAPALLRAAEGALYRAKAGGRNQTITA